jgi:hypothetical protein
MEGEDWCPLAGRVHTEVAGWRWTWWVVTARGLQQWCHHPSCRGDRSVGWGVPVQVVPLPDAVQIGVNQWLDAARNAGISAVRTTRQPSPAPPADEDAAGVRGVPRGPIPRSGRTLRDRGPRSFF